MMRFTLYQKKERRMLRLAQLIFDHWEEGSGMDTRLFEEPLIHDTMVIRGKSLKGGTYREHIVPRALIRDECLKMYDNHATIDDVKEMLMKHLWIAYITSDEAEQLDHGHKYKTTMPHGWVFGQDDPLDRLKVAGIEIIDAEEIIKCESQQYLG